jgi:hypothetical protein
LTHGPKKPDLSGKNSPKKPDLFSKEITEENRSLWETPEVTTAAIAVGQL